MCEWVNVCACVWWERREYVNLTVKWLWVEDADGLLDAHGDDKEEGQGVEAVDVDELDSRTLHFHRAPLDQGQVSTLSEDAQEPVRVGLTVEFLWGGKTAFILYNRDS